jgi:hypothetical protein
MKKNGKERTCKHLQAILPMLGAAPKMRVAPPAEELPAPKATKAPAAKAAPAKAAPAAKAAPDLLAEIRACLVAMDEHKVNMDNKPACLQELVRLAKLLYMSNLQPEDTGINGIVVFVSTGEVEGKKMSHSPRVKVALGRTTNIVAAVSIGTLPVLTGGKLAAHHEREVKEFITINYNTLMAYWNMEISTRQMVMAVLPIK